MHVKTSVTENKKHILMR